MRFFPRFSFERIFMCGSEQLTIRLECTRSGHNCSFINLFLFLFFVAIFQFAFFLFHFSGFIKRRWCAVNQKIIKLVFFTALAIGMAAAVKQQKPQLTTHGVEERDRRCPLHFDNRKIAFYPHETDCTRYYICAENGTLVDFACPNGLEFDADYSVRTIHTHTHILRTNVHLFLCLSIRLNRAQQVCATRKQSGKSDWKYFSFFLVSPIK